MRNETLRTAKATLRQWFAAQDDAYLTRVVDECRVGTFAYTAPCHCIRGLCEGGYDSDASFEPLALLAEQALNALQSYHPCPLYYDNDDDPYGDRLGRIRTLPMVLAEIRRRQRERTPATPIEVCAKAENGSR